MSSSRLSLPLAGEQPEVPLYTGHLTGELEDHLRLVTRRGLAEKIFPVSYPSKLPCPAWGISAEYCRMGSLLGRRENSVCHESHCYAKKGRFQFENVRKKLRQAYEGLFHPLWVPAGIFMIRWTAGDHWRWFHSGDIQDRQHLLNIITICLHTRDQLHWLPTREKNSVLSCKDLIPDNLHLRASGTTIDGPPPTWWPVTSTVFREEPHEGSYRCPAETQGGRCDGETLHCRACFDPAIEDVAYPLK